MGIPTWNRVANPGLEVLQSEGLDMTETITTSEVVRGTATYSETRYCSITVEDVVNDMLDRNMVIEDRYDILEHARTMSDGMDFEYNEDIEYHDHESNDIEHEDTYFG